MDLHSGYPYWLFNTPVLHTYHALTEDHKTDIVIIGGGISGALAAYELVKTKRKVTLVTSHHIGAVSTCASTSLLQYEIDTPLHELIQKAGKKTAERSYLLCHESIDALEKIHRQVGLKNIFQRKGSLLLASAKKDVEDLQKEYDARKSIGIKVQWLNEEQIQKKYGFKAPAAIYSTQAAQTDSYLFTQALVHWCTKHGLQVFDKTEIADIKPHRNNVDLLTKAGHTIKASYAVMATGYEAVKWVDKNVARLHSTYAIISEPFKRGELWKDECLIWETQHPYTYLRTTSDHRAIIGGKDETFASANKRDALITTKTKALVKAFNHKFPHLKFAVEYAWAGTFAETADGLPYIGTTPQLPRVYFALGYGGNGITFSQIAARIICDALTGKPNPDLKLFGFDRKIKTS